MGNTHQARYEAVIEKVLEAAAAFRRYAEGEHTDGASRQALIAHIEAMPGRMVAAIERQANCLADLLDMVPGAIDGWREVLVGLEDIASDDYEDGAEAVYDLVDEFWYGHKLYFYFNSDHLTDVATLAFERMLEMRSRGILTPAI